LNFCLTTYCSSATATVDLSLCLSVSLSLCLSVCLIVCRRQQVHIYPVFCKTGHFTVTIIIDQSLIESHMRAYHVTNFCMNPFVGLK